MVVFTLAEESERSALQKTLVESFSDASTHDFGVDGILPPGVKEGFTINKAFEKQTIYTIKLNKEIIGGIIIELRESKIYYLQTLWIISKYHNRHYGSQALEFIEKTHSDAIAWVLETPEQAKRNRYFYENHGYQKVSEEKFPNSNVVLYNYRKDMMP